MSHYIAGGLMLLLLCAAALLGIEAFGIYDAVRMVDSALLDGQLKLAADGGVSAAVERQVRRRIEAEGGDLSRLKVSGTRPGAPYGEIVTLQVAYEHGYALNMLVPGGSGWRTGIFRIQRTSTLMSGWQP